MTRGAYSIMARFSFSEKVSAIKKRINSPLKKKSDKKSKDSSKDCRGSSKEGGETALNGSILSQAVVHCESSLPNDDSEPVKDTIVRNFNNGVLYTSLGQSLVFLKSDKTNSEQENEEMKRFSKESGFSDSKETNGFKSTSTLVDTTNFDSRANFYLFCENVYEQSLLGACPLGIIAIGETGAGKSELIKSTREYLTLLGGPSFETERLFTYFSCCDIIFESFCNYKGLKNGNCSCFGRATEVFFNENGHACGGKVSLSLLDSNAIGSEVAGNRHSFNIFYELLSARREDVDHRELEIGPIQQFNYLNQPKSLDIPLRSPLYAKRLEQVIDALHILKFSKDEVGDIFRVISAILHVGNIEFEEKSVVKPESTGAGCLTKIKIESNLELQIVCRLLWILPKSLIALLSSKSVNGECIELTQVECYQMRDAFANFLYIRILNFLVEKFNKVLLMGTLRCGKMCINISLYDFPGYNVYGNGSLRQLCLNRFNERLMNCSKSIVLADEKEYFEEGLVSSRARESDAGTSTTSSQHSEGVNLDKLIDLLNKETEDPFGSSFAFETKLAKLTGARSKDSDEPFSQIPHARLNVSQFSRNVTYDISTFFGDNMIVDDSIFESVLRGCQMESNIFSAEYSFAGGSTVWPNACDKFWKEADNLLTSFADMKTYFLFCMDVAPCGKKKELDEGKIDHEIQLFGLEERKQAAANVWLLSFEFEEFANKFASLNAGFNSDRKRVKADFAKLCSRILLRAELVENKDYFMGKRKVFLKTWKQLQTLNDLNAESTMYASVLVTDFMRACFRKRIIEKAKCCKNTIWKERDLNQCWNGMYIDLNEVDNAAFKNVCLSTGTCLVFADVALNFTCKFDSHAVYVFVGVLGIRTLSLDKGESVKQIEVPLQNILGISVGEVKSDVIVVHFLKEGRASSAVFESWRKSEICSILEILYLNKTGKSLTIHVSNSIPILNMGELCAEIAFTSNDRKVASIESTTEPEFLLCKKVSCSEFVRVTFSVGTDDENRLLNGCSLSKFGLSSPTALKTDASLRVHNANSSSQHRCKEIQSAEKSKSDFTMKVSKFSLEDEESCFKVRSDKYAMTKKMEKAFDSLARKHSKEFLNLCEERVKELLDEDQKFEHEMDKLKYDLLVLMLEKMNRFKAGGKKYLNEEEKEAFDLYRKQLLTVQSRAMESLENRHSHERRQSLLRYVRKKWKLHKTQHEQLSALEVKQQKESQKEELFRVKKRLETSLKKELDEFERINYLKAFENFSGMDLKNRKQRDGQSTSSYFEEKDKLIRKLNRSQQSELAILETQNAEKCVELVRDHHAFRKEIESFYSDSERRVSEDSDRSIARMGVGIWR